MAIVRAAPPCTAVDSEESLRMQKRAGNGVCALAVRFAAICADLRQHASTRRSGAGKQSLRGSLSRSSVFKAYID